MIVSNRSRVVALALLIIAGAAAVWISVASSRRGIATGEHADRPPAAQTRPRVPYVVVRDFHDKASWNHVSLVPVDRNDPPRFVTSLQCERVHFTGRFGVCLSSAADAMSMRYTASIFDDQFAEIARFPLTGVPSRARMSRDGSLAAVTVFESGHSYASGAFSTRTSLFDSKTKASLGDLEQFQVTRDGQPFRAADFNYWGVTFAGDNDTFFATLATGGTKYLVKGRVSARSLSIVRPNVECPSLSPDDARIAYKRADGKGGWGLRVLTLADGTDIALSAERRSVDDQVEWLDTRRILYHQTGSNGADVWMMDLDGGAPQLFIAGAYSPAIVR